MKGSLNFALPRKGMDQLMQTNCDFDVGQRLAVVVQELQIGDEAERIGHRDDAGLQPDPVPGDACRLRFSFVAPQRLPSARGIVVAEVQYARTEVGQVQLRGATCLPQ